MSANASPLSRLSDYDFELPEDLIAQHPAAERSASRLLVVNDGALSDRQFTDLPDLLNPGDLLVMNDTRVLRARFFGHKASGGQIEVLIERIHGDGRSARAQIRASKSPKANALPFACKGNLPTLIFKPAAFAFCSVKPILAT